MSIVPPVRIKRNNKAINYYELRIQLSLRVVLL